MNIFRIIKKLIRIPLFLYRFFRCEIAGHLWRITQTDSLTFQQLQALLSGERCVYCKLTYEKFKVFGGWFGAENLHQTLIEMPQPKNQPQLVQIKSLSENSN